MGPFQDSREIKQETDEQRQKENYNSLEKLQTWKNNVGIYRSKTTRQPYRSNSCCLQYPPNSAFIKGLKGNRRKCQILFQF